MKVIYVILFLFLQNYFYAQTLSARVVDNNDNPVEGVKVFFDRSTIVAFTDNSGFFEIPKSAEIANAYLIFYHPLFEIIIESETDDLLPVYQLSQRADNLKVINYNSSPFSKKEMLSVFKRTLFGSTKSARNAEILNEEDISLKFDESNNTLTVKSVQPLYIINNVLGYHLEYHLEQFEVEYSALSLEDENISFINNAGYSYFKDVDNTKSGIRDRLLQSSFRYFLKALINENYKALNYKIVVDDKKIKPSDLFRIEQDDENLFKITFNSSIIDNQDDEYFLAKIEFLQKDDVKIIELFKPFLLVDQYGNILNTQDVRVIDNISNKRLADKLPINYN